MRNFFVILAALTLTSCLKTEVKNLNGEGVISPSAPATGNLDTFRINFASTAATASTNPVFVQGAANTASFFISTCNAAGTGCQCDFYMNNTLVGSAAGAASIAYDQQGNFVRCIPPNASNKNYVVLRNIAGTKSTTPTPITLEANLTVAQLLGTLSRSKVNTIYRYSCAFNFLQKNLITSASLDCSNQPGGLRFITAQFNYYLFADGVSNGNFNQKASDILYGGGYICGMQVRQVDCVTAASSQPTPTAEFALYKEAAGPFSVPVTLTQAPSFNNGITQLYGYAAPVSSFAGGSCPPGLVRKDIYTANLGAGNTYIDAAFCNGACTTDNNIVAYQDIRIGTFAVAPSNLSVTRKSGSGATASGTVQILDDTTYNAGDTVVIAGTSFQPDDSGGAGAASWDGGNSDPNLAAANLAARVNAVLGPSGFAAVAAAATVTINGPFMTLSEADAGTNNFQEAVIVGVGNGDCNGTTCEPPGGASAAYGTQPVYTASGSSGFCVIPNTMPDFPQ